jgi:hypothetical protein
LRMRIRAPRRVCVASVRRVRRRALWITVDIYSMWSGDWTMRPPSAWPRRSMGDLFGICSTILRFDTPLAAKAQVRYLVSWLSLRMRHTVGSGRVGLVVPGPLRRKQAVGCTGREVDRDPSEAGVPGLEVEVGAAWRT